MNVTNPQLPPNDYDEIDLFELIENLWAQKLLITAITAIALLFGGAYTVIAPEKWTAEARVSAPKAAAMDALNPPELAVFKQRVQIDERMDDLSVTELNKVAPEVKPDEVLENFLAELRSVQTLLEFEAVYDGELFQLQNSPTVEQRIEVANGFLASNLQVTAPSKSAVHHTIQLTQSESMKSAEVLRNYMEFVNARVLSKRARDLELGIRRAIQTNTFEIQRAERSYIRRLEEDLALLEEALQIAKAAGIQDNQAGLFVGPDNNRLTEASGLYLRGQKLLSAEIQALQSKMGAAGLIPEVRDLQAENELLSGILIDTSTAMAYTLEKPATPPTGRDAPKTQLILALSIVLGGMIGVLAALIRSAIRNRQARLAG
jgi:chain length determinant protein (polysaccharide antigen chain regulator)